MLVIYDNFYYPKKLENPNDILENKIRKNIFGKRTINFYTNLCLANINDVR